VTDQDGHIYQNGVAGESQTPVLNVGVVDFDIAGFVAGGEEATFRFEIPLLRDLEPDGNEAVVQGPWTFDFTLPIVAGKTVETAQTITVNSVSVSLEQVVVTPTEARFTSGCQRMRW
jgi:hypothetical protein